MTSLPSSQPNRRRILRWGAASTLAMPFIGRSGAALAAWPADKAIRIVVPFAPGGPADIAARVVAQGLGEALAGSTVVVENKAGAGGNIGIAQVARSEPDGYTLMACSSALTLNPSLYDQVQYDPVKDFEAVCLTVASPNVFVATNDSGITSLAELIDRAKKNPDKMSYASPGTGTTPQLAYELLKARAGIKVAHVAHGGAGPAAQAVLSKAVDNGCIALPGVHAHIKGGLMKGLAVTAEKRWHDLPDVPTMDELGHKDFLLDTKVFISAPAKTPAAIVDRIGEAIVATLAKPAVRTTMQNAGFDILARTPAQTREIIAREVPMWREVVAQSGIKLKG